MDEFAYHNIFDTKGIEYLIVIAFLLMLVPFWLVLNKRIRDARAHSIAKEGLSFAGSGFPMGYFFSPRHTWSFLEKSGLARVGLDDLLTRFVGDLKLHVVGQQGDSIEKGDLIAELEQEGKVLKVYSPVSGEIVDFNEPVLENSGSLTRDPFGEGWILRIRPRLWKKESAAMLLAGDARQWARGEWTAFRDFLAARLSNNTADPRLVLQEGGEMLPNPLSQLGSEDWQAFQERFLNP